MLWIEQRQREDDSIRPLCHGDVSVSAIQTVAADAQVRSLSQPWRGVVSEGAQASLPLEGLPVRQLSVGGRTTEGDGRTGCTPKVRFLLAYSFVLFSAFYIHF